MSTFQIEMSDPWCLWSTALWNYHMD